MGGLLSREYRIPVLSFSCLSGILKITRIIIVHVLFNEYTTPAAELLAVELVALEAEVHQTAGYKVEDRHQLLKIRREGSECVIAVTVS